MSVSCNNRDRNIDAWSTLKGKRCSGAETPSCASGQLPALFPEREFDWNFSSSSLTRPQCLFGMSVHYYYHHVTINVGRVGGADIIVIYCGDAAHSYLKAEKCAKIWTQVEASAPCWSALSWMENVYFILFFSHALLCPRHFSTPWQYWILMILDYLLQLNFLLWSIIDLWVDIFLLGIFKKKTLWRTGTELNVFLRFLTAGVYRIVTSERVALFVDHWWVIMRRKIFKYMKK